MFFLHKPAEYAIQICPSRYTNDAVSLVVWQVVVGCSHQLNACADINALADGAQNHCTAFLAVPRRCPASGSNSRRALHRQPTPIYCWPAAVDMRWVREWRCFRGSECRGRLWRGSASTDTMTTSSSGSTGRQNVVQHATFNLTHTASTSAAAAGPFHQHHQHWWQNSIYSITESYSKTTAQVSQFDNNLPIKIIQHNK